MIIQTQVLQFILLICVLNGIFSFIFTYLSLKIAKKLNIVDSSTSNPNRKNQQQAVPLLGATGFILSSLFFTGILWLIRKEMLIIPADLSLWLHDNLASVLGHNLERFKLFWVFIGAVIILIAGFFDDKFQFGHGIMFFPTLLAIFITVYFGDLKIEAWSYPYQSLIPNSKFLHYFLSFFWIGLCLSATKFLDGHDGLVGTVGIIGFLTIAATSLIANVNQPLIFAMSMIWAAGVAGFLPWNLPDAKVYLGEAGSQIVGFMIGVLSILSGAKVATASTVIGWFIYDIAFVIGLRIWQRKNPLQGDRLHWHFRLMDLGLKKYQVLLVTFIILIFTALLGVYLPTNKKPYLLVFQGGFLVSLFAITEVLNKGKKD